MMENTGYLMSGSRSSVSSMVWLFASLQLRQIPASSSSGANSSPQTVQYSVIDFYFLHMPSVYSILIYQMKVRKGIIILFINP